MFVPRSGEHFSPILSLLFVGVGLATPCVWWIVHAMRGLWKNARLASQASADLEGHRLLRPGPIAVRGRVVVLKGQNFAMRVEIDLQGRQWRIKNGYNHAWTEIARRVTCHPFAVQLDSGQLLDVSPSEATQLVDKLDQLTIKSRTERTKTAELSPGEQVYIVGTLKKDVDLSGEFVDFREAPTAKWTLQADLLSAEPLRDRFAARRSFYARWLVYGLAATALVHGAICEGYYARMHRGSVVPAIVTGKRTYVSGSGKSRTRHHKVDLRWEGGSSAEEAASSTYDKVERGDLVSLLVVAGRKDLNQLGNRPTIHVGLVLLGLLILLGGSATFSERRKSSRPWYWKPKLESTGAGQLPDV